jgi:hypothetical protein
VFLNRLRRRTLADVAPLGFGDGDLLLAAGRRFFEGNLQIIAKVVAALGLGGIVAGGAEELIEDAARAEHLAKDLKRIVETTGA